MPTHRCARWGFCTYWIFDNGWAAGCAHIQDKNGDEQQILTMPAYLFGNAHTQECEEFINKTKAKKVYNDNELMLELTRIMTLPPYDNSANELLSKIMEQRK